MVLDATIRPSGQVGLQPGAGLKRFAATNQWDVKLHGIVYAPRAVALQCRWLGTGTGGQRPNRRVLSGP
jgi:hypothetical protein